MEYDFSGWATRNDLRCSDGRTIVRDAFKENDGRTVPLVWNHDHGSPYNVLGHALLENRKEGVYAYCTFNDSDAAQAAKEAVLHKDITALSIYANKLVQKAGNVLHGMIREVSLVHAGANPGAFIDSIMAHGEESEDEAVIYTGECFSLYHSDDKSDEKEESEEKKEDENSDETVADVLKTLSEKQLSAVYAVVGAALEAGDGSDEDDDNSNTKETKEEKSMKHNVFDDTEGTAKTDGFICHSDQVEIIELAKSSGCGTFKEALKIYFNDHEELAHAFTDGDLDTLFPEYKDVKPGMPELLTRDYTWVDHVMQKVHKSPFSRTRTRQVDIRDSQLAARGYKKKGDKKETLGNFKLLNRTTDPQTVYVRDDINRDDKVDLVDFDYVQYEYSIMRGLMNEKLAIAFMIGDGKEDGDTDKIYEEHIRSILNDDDLYTIHAEVDIDAAKKSLQGTNTSANFGENYIFAEAIIEAALYARENYKGSGSIEFYCTPRTINQMLLARDLNGRRIYDSVSDIASALNVTAIHTAEQFAGIKRKDKQEKEHDLYGIFVNLSDYNVGSTKGGEITKFNQFDIDFNKEKFLMETRVSGALTRVYSAIVLEGKAQGE